MTKSFQWPDSPAPTDQDVEVLREKWEELLSQYQSVPQDGEQDPGEPDQTIYEWLQNNSDTTELVQHLERMTGVRDVLQYKQSVHTIWAPTNSAFASFSEDDSKLDQFLQHHISPHSMPLLRILDTPNIPTLVYPPALNGALRLRLRPSSHGIKINGYATMIKSDLRLKNGIIHLVDHVLSLPRPLTEVILSSPEAQFSRLRQALQKTGLENDLASAKFVGATFFAPNDQAFLNLGQETEAFLFNSPEGTRYLRALLEYHMVPNETLYSNAFYHGDDKTGSSPPIGHPPRVPAVQAPPSASSQQPENGRRILKGQLTHPLPTLLGGERVHVEIFRYGGMISMFVREGQASVITQDIVALDGVVHVVDRVLLPSFDSLFPTAAPHPLDATRPSWQPDLEELKTVLSRHFHGV